MPADEHAHFLVRYSSQIDNRLNEVSHHLGRGFFLYSTYLRGALDPYKLFAAEVLATILEIDEAHPFMAHSMLARSAGYALPLVGRAWLCERQNT